MHIDENIKDIVEPYFEAAPFHMGDALGMEFLHISKEKVKMSMPVNENTKQPFGLLHGGASVALAESAASIAGWLNVVEDNKNAVGVNIDANHLQSVTDGTVIACAKPIRRGRKIHVWEIKIRDENDKLICICRCTLAIVDKR